MAARGGPPAGDPSRAASADSSVRPPRAFVDLHCHTRASFDSLADPVAVARAAAQRGLTHLAITDHDRIDGALEAFNAAPADLRVIVGEEIKSADGDMIALFLRELIPPRLSALETIAAVREQGGLIGVPHPYDRFRGFGSGTCNLEDVAGSVDWIETYNARVVGGDANERAALFAHQHDLPGVAASDSHTVLEVGVAYNAVSGDPGTPEGLLEALRQLEIVPGRASYYVRLWTPFAKMVQALRGNGRTPAGRRA